jgi:branched-chain amino acid transport system ATP-binding protein
MTPILEGRDLSISFGGVRAVHDLSLRVERGTITLISGASRPHAGSVLVEGRDLTGQPPDRMRAAGLARSFQITNLFFELSVFENLRLAAQVLEPAWKAWLPVSASLHARRRVDELLDQFRLGGKAEYPVGKLSHGEQRWLEIAVALACRPKILLLDEPTQGMSHGDTEETARLVRALAGDVTILLIEHDIGLVMNLSDHVIVMHQGEKIAEGPPAHIRQDPAVQAAYFGGA